MTKFIQLHYLTSYPAALLNRDDAGFAKRIPFGGATRTRISSQCQKRHWRTFEGEHSLREINISMSIRSRRTFERFVLAPLLEDGVAQELADAVTEGLMALTLGESAKAKKSKEESVAPTARTGQITVLGRPELDYLLREARELCAAVDSPKQAREALKKWPKEKRDNLKTLRNGAGLDAALFGRMVTSDILARGDAAIHVAHAFTVHAEAAESDYFSAVDDLLQDNAEEEALGSGHIGSVELTSGLFYGYTVIDVPLLVSNLEGCAREDWRDADPSTSVEVIERLVHLIATVSPGAKLGSTAPYSYAHLVFAEGGSAQPRTLANAFMNPVRDRSDLLKSTYNALGSYVASLDRMYGVETRRVLAAIDSGADLIDRLDVESSGALAELARTTAGWVRE